MSRQYRHLFFITLALTVLFSAWTVSYSTPLATLGHSALAVAPVTPVPLAPENRVLTSAMPAISASTPASTDTATSTPTHTPTSQPGPPALYAPEDGAVLPQPVPPNEWEFHWQARMGPCYTTLGVGGPPGGVGFSVTRYPYEGYSYRYTTDEYIPNNALGPYHWSVGVVCPLGTNHSESRTFWVEPAPSMSPTPLPTSTVVYRADITPSTTELEVSNELSAVGTLYNESTGACLNNIQFLLQTRLESGEQQSQDAPIFVPVRPTVLYTENVWPGAQKSVTFDLQAVRPGRVMLDLSVTGETLIGEECEIPISYSYGAAAHSNAITVTAKTYLPLLLAATAPPDCFATPTGTPTATVTPQPVCTAPACGPDEVLYCPGECPGGCGHRCATPTSTPNVSAERTER